MDYQEAYTHLLSGAVAALRELARIKIINPDTMQEITIPQIENAKAILADAIHTTDSKLKNGKSPIT